MLKVTQWSKNMRPPKKPRQKCTCEVQTTGADNPDVCMECDGEA